MSKPTKTQWDFGELFPTEATRRVLTVSELTVQVKRLLEKQVGLVWVTGEITNLRAQSSGHIYFTLKDASTQLACGMSALIKMCSMPSLLHSREQLRRARSVIMPQSNVYAIGRIPSSVVR